MTTKSLHTNLMVDELIATVTSYGVGEISADLRASLEEIASDLAEDDGAAWWVRSGSPSLVMRLAS
jgi:hypothetical protein